MVNTAFRNLAVCVLAAFSLLSASGTVYAEEVGDASNALARDYSADLEGFKQALEASLSARKAAIDKGLSSATAEHTDLPKFLNKIAQDEQEQLAAFCEVQATGTYSEELVEQYIISSYMEGLTMQAEAYPDEVSFWKGWEEGEKKRSAAVIEICQLEDGAWSAIDQSIIEKMTEVTGPFEMHIYETEEAMIVQALTDTGVDGQFGYASRIALKSFEAENNMILNGVINAATISSLVDVIGYDAAMEKVVNAALSGDTLDAMLQKAKGGEAAAAVSE